MEIEERDFDTEMGFAWIKFFDKEGNDYILQACLMEREECKDEERRWRMVQGKKPLYKKTIDRSDDGMMDGLCWDANKDAFDKFGYDFCFDLFYREIKKIGVRIC